MPGSLQSLVVFSIDERQFALDITAVKSNVAGATTPGFGTPAIRQSVTPGHSGINAAVSNVLKRKQRILVADTGLAELPVVLVTSLGSREFQERGIEAGANAYIVKSSFDQSNLLDIIRKLL